MSNSNNCQQTHKLLEKLISASAEDLDRMQEDVHLKQCAVCRKTFLNFTSDFKSWQTIEIDLPSKMSEKITSRLPHHQMGLQRSLWKSVAIAAASVVAGLFISRTILPQPESSEQAVAIDYGLNFSSDDTFPVDYFNE